MNISVSHTRRHDHLTSQLGSVRRPKHLIWNHLGQFSYLHMCLASININFLSADFLWYLALFIKNRKWGKLLLSKAFQKVTSHLQLIKLIYCTQGLIIMYHQAICLRMVCSRYPVFSSSQLKQNCIHSVHKFASLI